MTMYLLPFNSEMNRYNHDDIYKRLFAKVDEKINAITEDEPPIQRFILVMQLLLWYSYSTRAQSGQEEKYLNALFKPGSIETAIVLNKTLEKFFQQTDPNNPSWMRFQEELKKARLVLLQPQIRQSIVLRVLEYFQEQLPEHRRNGGLSPCSLDAFIEIMHASLRSNRNQNLDSDMAPRLMAAWGLMRRQGVEHRSASLQVYCDPNSQLSLRLLNRMSSQKQSLTLTLDSNPEVSVLLIQLAALLARIDVPQLLDADHAISNPSDRALGIVPISYSFNFDAMLFERYPQKLRSERLKSGLNLVRDILNRSNQEVLLALPTHLLATSFGSHNRAFLLESQRIWKVVRLPGVSSSSGLGDLALSLLFCSKNRSNTVIEFIDATGLYLNENDDSFQEILQTECTSKLPRCRVNIGEISSSGNWVLDAAYWCRQKNRPLDAVYANGKELQELTTKVRWAGAKGEASQGLELREISPSMFSSYGALDLNNLARTVATKFLADSDWKDRQDRVLDRNDILITSKGRMDIGYVSIFPVSKEEEKARNRVWIAAQTCTVLRVKPNTIDPHLLYLYLRSEPVQEQIRMLAMRTGSSLPIIRVYDLDTFMIHDVVKSCNERGQQIFQRLQEHEETIRTLRSQQWGLLQEFVQLVGMSGTSS